MRTSLSIAACIVGIFTAGASAQSINLRFGSVATTPGPGYAAAGQAGVWNSLLLTPEYAQQPLVNLQGASIAAHYYQAGSASLLSYNNPATSGDDERLMDNMLLSTNSPTDGCFWVVGLTPGPYEVTIYAMTPNDPARLSRTRVDNGSPGPTMVGGAWPGQHQAGISYSRFNVTTTDGTIAFHDGLYGGVLQSGMNGAQFRYLGMQQSDDYYTAGARFDLRERQRDLLRRRVRPGTLFYQWQLEVSPGSWSTLGNDPMPLPCGGGAFAYASPINSASVHIGVHPCAGVSSYRVRALVSNACGGTASDPATLTLVFSGDLNCDCTVNGLDVGAFVQEVLDPAAYATAHPGCNPLHGDFNGDSAVNALDVDAFLNCVIVGNCS